MNEGVRVIFDNLIFNEFLICNPFISGKPALKSITTFFNSKTIIC